MYHIFYYKSTKDIDWVIAHIYEHAFIYELNKFLENYKLPAYLIGNISGETFRDGSLFVKCILNNKEAFDLIVKFLSSTKIKVSKDAIDNAMKQIEVEDCGKLKINDQSEFNKQLRTLDARQFTKIQDLPLIVADRNRNSTKACTFKSKKGDYHGVELLVKTKRPSDEQIALLNRMIWPISETLVYLSRYKYGLYSYDDSLMYEVKNKNLLCYRAVFIANKKITKLNFKEIFCLAKEIIADPENQKFIEQNIINWSKDDSLQSTTIEYFRNTGVMIGSLNMINLVNHSTIKTILDQLSFSVKFYEEIPDY